MNAADELDRCERLRQEIATLRANLDDTLAEGEADRRAVAQLQEELAKANDAHWNACKALSELERGLYGEDAADELNRLRDENARLSAIVERLVNCMDEASALAHHEDNCAWGDVCDCWLKDAREAAESAREEAKQ